LIHPRSPMTEGLIYFHILSLTAKNFTHSFIPLFNHYLLIYPFIH
jgi:hypothetical protein